MTAVSRPAGWIPLASGIILPIPDAEAVVGHLRERHDPQTRYGVPAHMTLLYPFAHPSIVGETLGAIRELFCSIRGFDFSLVEVRRFPAAAYLHPEPSSPFVQLTATLAQRWPEFPPYGGAFSSVIPHLTIADQAASDVLDTVERDVASHLPIRCRAAEASLMCSDEHGFWSRHDDFGSVDLGRPTYRGWNESVRNSVESETTMPLHIELRGIGLPELLLVGVGVVLLWGVSRLKSK